MEAICLVEVLGWIKSPRTIRTEDVRRQSQLPRQTVQLGWPVVSVASLWLNQSINQSSFTTKTFEFGCPSISQRWLALVKTPPILVTNLHCTSLPPRRSYLVCIQKVQPPSQGPNHLCRRLKSSKAFAYTHLILSVRRKLYRRTGTDGAFDRRWYILPDTSPDSGGH